MAAAKLKTMININHCGQKVQLGNINEKDLDVYCKPEEVKVRGGGGFPNDFASIILTKAMC